ncbi:M15 family metallopeptidase [Anabaena sp. UHCC 0451]|uniref:M15 family metallopeptidase n=1 Tax=Anabaena sp. UHCC 0451 TaxID=2055235 RepID=UPI002B220E73|nr:M15 family metallopeptidase [Anabaena sp. UHCC 0451]MEA5575184.1 M15 family metallopeptidase [Anabaena sp. UHCC 0451]
MKKAGFPGKPQNSSPEPGDDIPAALRDTPDSGSKLRVQPLVLVIGGVLGFVVMAVGSGFLFFLTAPQENAENQPTPVNSIPAATNTPAINNDTVLGHLAYPEAPESELLPITADGRIRMRTAAAQRFQQMAQAARSAGIILVPISGFRAVKEQEQLFFNVGAQRNQTPAQRAALSAPPGHSEHHTGYAVDIGDGGVPATNLQANFENTKAFVWLQANAARFGFELSFPKDNTQGVSYEPWHWRFVGDRNSLETFYKARNIKPVQ